MKRTVFVLSLAAAAALVTLLAQDAPKPKRVNKAVELLAAGQPIYYTGGHGGFDEGVKLARTWADFINYELEHGAFDIPELRRFMQGLVKGGPTKSGHRTPAVIVTLPVTGNDEAMIRNNAWVIQQVLATGVHGILLCHARTPGAVKAFVEATRYVFQKKGVDTGMLGEGTRGSGSQGFAAQIWGIPAADYIRRADPWPLNPDGEILLGLKIEDRHALANAEKTAAVPGIGFAEWGPGDMGWSFGLLDAHDPPYPPQMAAARARVLAACKAAKIAFLNQTRPEDVEKMIDEGVMVGSGGQAAAEKGRRYTKRTMPW
jgi:4-hydroxy-2-oxoheptanedioate aldolase